MSCGDYVVWRLCHVAIMSCGDYVRIHTIIFIIIRNKTLIIFLYFRVVNSIIIRNKQSKYYFLDTYNYLPVCHIII